MNKVIIAALSLFISLSAFSQINNPPISGGKPGTSGTVGGFTNYIVVAAATGAAATDTANIQYALDQTTNNGVSQYGGKTEVYIPAGFYVVNTLRIRTHGTIVQGAGQERTRIYAASNTNDVFTADGFSPVNYGGTNGMWFITVRDLSVYKTITHYTNGISSAFNFRSGTTGQKLSRSKFENVLVYGFFFGFNIDHAVGVTWNNCEVYGNNYPFWLEKVDAALVINCFAGDAMNGYYTNLFGTNYSAAYTYKPNATPTGGFSFTAIGGEARRCNVAFDLQDGNIFISGFNTEGMPNGPIINVGSSVDSLALEAFRCGRLSTNLNPIIKFAAGTAQKSRVQGFDYSGDSSPYPPIEIASATDYLEFFGYPATVTNTATSTAYRLPKVRNLPYYTYITNNAMADALALTTNSVPPAAAYTHGGTYVWNSNSTLYLLKSAPNSTAWTSTNFIAFIAPGSLTTNQIDATFYSLLMAGTNTVLAGGDVYAASNNVFTASNNFQDVVVNASLWIGTNNFWQYEPAGMVVGPNIIRPIVTTSDLYVMNGNNVSGRLYLGDYDEEEKGAAICSLGAVLRFAVNGDPFTPVLQMHSGTGTIEPMNNWKFAGDGSGLTNLYSGGGMFAGHIIASSGMSISNNLTIGGSLVASNFVGNANGLTNLTASQSLTWAGPTNTFTVSPVYPTQRYLYTLTSDCEITNIAGIVSGYPCSGMLWFTNSASSNCTIRLPATIKTLGTVLADAGLVVTNAKTAVLTVEYNGSWTNGAAAHE